MKFVKYKIEPVVDTGEFCEVVSPEKADFWSLYGYDEDGFAHCIGDYSTQEGAEQIKAAILGGVIAG